MEWLKLGCTFVKKIYNGTIVLALIILGGVIAFTNCDFYKERFQVPRCNLEHTETTDVVRTDIELSNMSIVMIPIIVVKYENEVIDAVRVTNYYNKNYATLEYVEGIGTKCSMEIAEGQRIKMDRLAESINHTLGKKLAKQKGDVQFDVYIGYLLQGTWQNEKANTSRSGYWYFADGVARHIVEEEERNWEKKLGKEVDLDSYEEGISDNEQVMSLIKSCQDIICR